MFACSAQHYAWLAHKCQIKQVTIDLLALRIEPSEFDIERNRTLAAMCQKALLRNIDQLAPPANIGQAVLTAEFGIADYREESGAELIGRSVFVVVLTDDRGKKWSVEHSEERFLIQP